MPIELRTETIISARGVPKLLGPIGRNGSHMHVSQVIRAITHGLAGHRLEALRVGKSWVTSVEAVERWLRAQTPGPKGAETLLAPNTAPRRMADMQVDKDVRELLYPKKGSHVRNSARSRLGTRGKS
jgi:hypothetical protein